MQKLEVFGANKLKGQIKISGSKNASLPILAATLLSRKKVYLKNLPRVKDIETMVSLLQSLGSKINFNKNNLNIDNKKQIKNFASYSLVKTMRAGILVLGPLLAKLGKAKVSLPGGCAIGTRPVDIHLNALSKLGVKYKIIQGYVHATAPKGLIGNKIRFSKISVGATENLTFLVPLIAAPSSSPVIKRLIEPLNFLLFSTKLLTAETNAAIELFMSLAPLPIRYPFFIEGLNGFTVQSFIFPAGTTSK